MPALREADSAAESGRGLQLVSSLSSEWGWWPQGLGKVTWAMILA